MKKFMSKWASFGVMVAVILVVILATTGTAPPEFLKMAVVDAANSPFQLSGITNLNNKTYTPGSTVPVSGEIKNIGSTTRDVNVEVRFVAERNQQYLAAVSPTSICVPGEEDSVAAIKIVGLAAGQKQAFTVNAKVPTSQSVLKPSSLGGNTTSNWDDRYFAVVGAYAYCGEGYYSKETFTDIIVTAQSNPPATGTESCEKTSDCSGWLVGKGVCEDGWCVKPEPFSFDEYKTKITAWYEANTLAAWAIGVVVLIFIVMIAWGKGDQ